MPAPDWSDLNTDESVRAAYLSETGISTRFASCHKSFRTCGSKAKPKKPPTSTFPFKELRIDNISHYDINELRPPIGKQYSPLAQRIEAATAFGQGLAIGLNLSTTCAEDLPFITEAQIVRSSAGSFEDDVRVRAQLKACKIWDVRRASSQFVSPVRTRAPMLMISGASDPATPPQFGRAALPYLPNARQIVIPHASHEVESNCTDGLIVKFVRTNDTKPLEAAKCIGDSHRPPFATSMKGFGG